MASREWTGRGGAEEGDEGLFKKEKGIRGSGFAGRG
jgi:hypothetical protein